jgi:hypothetical protein
LPTHSPCRLQLGFASNYPQAGWDSSIELAPRARFEVIGIESLRGPDVVELVLLVLFVLVASIGAFVGMGQDLIASGLQYELGKLFR